MSEEMSQRESTPPARVGVVAPMLQHSVGYVTEIDRLRALREFYIQGRQQTLDRLRGQIENERSKTQSEVEELTMLLVESNNLLNSLQGHQEHFANVLTSTVGHIEGLQNVLQQQSHEEEIRAIEDRAKTLIIKLRDSTINSS